MRKMEDFLNIVMQLVIRMQISAITVLVIKVSNGMVEHKNEVKVKRLR